MLNDPYIMVACNAGCKWLNQPFTADEMHIESNYWTIRLLSIIGSARGDHVARATTDPLHLFCKSHRRTVRPIRRFALPCFNPETARLYRKRTSTRNPLVRIQTVIRSIDQQFPSFVTVQEDDNVRWNVRRYCDAKDTNRTSTQCMDYAKGESQH